MPDPSTPTQPRRRGAPLGNQNARKHGFYSKYLPPKDCKDLENSEFHGLDEEINMVRIYLRRLIASTPADPTSEESIQILHVLCLATTSLTRLLRVQNLIAPQAGELDQILDQALQQAHLDLQLKNSDP